MEHLKLLFMTGSSNNMSGKHTNICMLLFGCEVGHNIEFVALCNSSAAAECPGSFCQAFHAGFHNSVKRFLCALTLPWKWPRV